MPVSLVHERRGEDCECEARLGYVVWPSGDGLPCAVFHLPESHCIYQRKLWDALVTVIHL